MKTRIKNTKRAHELPEIRLRVDEMERRISTYQSEERRWKEQEMHIMELIRGRESEIQSLKSIFSQIYRNYR